MVTVVSTELDIAEASHMAVRTGIAIVNGARNRETTITDTVSTSRLPHDRLALSTYGTSGNQLLPHYSLDLTPVR